MALSPPFVMSLAVSSTGIVAAGTADGRLLIGFGAESCLTMKKRPKKWLGLVAEETLLIKIAEGPVVALYVLFLLHIWLIIYDHCFRAFVQPRRLVASTLRGVLTVYNLIWDPDEGSLILDDEFQKESSGLEKVNALVVDEQQIILGGLDKDGKGVIEVWKQET